MLKIEKAGRIVMNYWIGQGFGILATITDISIPQFKKKWQMLVANIAVNTFWR